MPLGNGERYYSPLLGRFLQEDSYVGMPDSPWSLNRYSYTFNNPFSYSDPSGNAPQNLDKEGEIEKYQSYKSYIDMSNSSDGWTQVKGFAGLLLYETVDTLTFNSASKQDRILTQYSKGEISGWEALGRTTANLAIGSIGIAAGFATGGQSWVVQGAVMAGASVVQKGLSETYEKAYEGRTEYSSVGDYLLTGAIGFAFGAGGAVLGKAFQGAGNAVKEATAVESTMGLGTRLKTAFRGAIKGSDEEIVRGLTQVRNASRAIARGAKDAFETAFGQPAFAVAAEGSGVFGSVADDLAGRLNIRNQNATGSSGSSRVWSKKDVPSATKGFKKWFDSISAEELGEMYKIKAIKERIEDLLRGDGGEHEFFCVALAPIWKRWGVLADDVMGDFAISIRKLNGVTPEGEINLIPNRGGVAKDWIHSTGKRGSFAENSTTVHNELQAIIRSSNSLQEFKENIRPWAERWLHGGYSDLPPGFHR